jgi:hypothetical protein
MVKPEDIEPTAADIQNGWTREKLAEHVNQAEAREYHQLMNRLFPTRPKLVIESCKSFDPHGYVGYDPHGY